MRRIWSGSQDYLPAQGTRAMLGRAAALVEPSADLQSDAPNLIASMLAAGYDQDAARWSRAVSQMDDENADQAWAMLALGSPDGSGVDLSFVESTPSSTATTARATSAALCSSQASPGLGGSMRKRRAGLSGRFGLRIGNRSPWTRMIDRAAAFGQAGTVLVLTGTGLQAATFEEIPPVARLPCDRGSSAHRPGVYGAHDRRGSARADVT